MLATLAAAMLFSASAAEDAGFAALERIHSAYRLTSSGLYAEFAPGGDDRPPAFNWSVGVMLSALNAGAARNERFRPWLKEYAGLVERYWNPASPVAGYDVLPVPKPTDRYYDDNAWMVLALLETAKILDDTVYVDRAERALRYVLSGESDRLGGGIYWRESDKASKNTCSNAPSVAAALAVHAVRPDPKTLAAAKRLYDWTFKHLRDPQDGLMWDNIALDGKIEKTKWSYNTALMIESARKLYLATEEARYRDEAIAFADAAAKHWLDPNNGAVKCEAAFAHLLLEALWDAETTFGRRWVETGRTLSTLASMANSRGFFGRRFDAKAPEDGDRFDLLPQASYARALLVGAARLGR